MANFGHSRALIAASLLCTLVPFSGAVATGHNARDGQRFDHEILVSAAVSMKDSMSEIAQKFEQQSPRTKVHFNFGASGQLAQQIRRGADVDVFVSASPQPVLQLISEDLADKASMTKIANNELVVISPKNSVAIKDLEMLARQPRIAIGNPKTVPAGEYARKFLEGESLYHSLEAKNSFVYGESVRQILQYVQSGNVDAGLVYKTDTTNGANVKLGFSVPESKTGPISYVLVTMRKSKEPLISGAFARFCTSTEARSILKRRGFKSTIE